MAFFFPNEALRPYYRQLYGRLSAVERGMVLREFIGVTYRRRFHFFRRNRYAHPQQAFKHNLKEAARRQHRRFCIARRIWRKEALTRAYLPLIFRHYILGFLVQRLRKQFGDRLAAEEGCYPDAPLVLAALEWLVAHETLINALVAEQVDQVLEEDSRHLYLYCLRAYVLMRAWVKDEELREAADTSLSCHSGGSVALGAELEFSNLGHRAAFEHSFGRHHQDRRFHNFIYFHHFFLEDVTWRLGGYLDHHVRLRRYLPVPWIGGFFEYNLVRMDYPRNFSMPLTRDAGFLARYIQQVMAFNHQVAPHSLHLNVECVSSEALQVPEFGDYLCLLLLGGDLVVNDEGQVQERRFARNELIKMIQQREHLSLFDDRRHRVSEFAFLRLTPDRSAQDWQTLILVLSGFNRVSDLERYCLEAQGELLHWAHQPTPVEENQIEAFLGKIEAGLRADTALSESLVTEKMQRVRDALKRKNQWLRKHC
nr:hypothetical protein [uncultured Desulfuromonas sp.]